MDEPALIDAEKTETDARRDRSPLLALLVLVTAVFLLAIPEGLDPDEARFLVRVLDGDVQERPVVIQEAWSFLVGTMERPSRLLGVLSSALMLVLVFLASRGLSASARVATLLGLAATGLFWRQALTIGAETWPALLCAILIVFLRGLNWGRGWSALAGAITAAIIGLTVPEKAIELADLVDIAARFSGRPEASLTASILTALLFGALLYLTKRGALLVLTVLALVLLPVGFPALGELDAGHLKTALVAMLPALALAIGVAADQVPERRRLVLGLLAALVLIAAAEPLHDRVFSGTNDRLRLDRATPHLPDSGWMALLGERGPALRYYERVGHRGPGRSILIETEEEVRALIDRVMIDLPPVVLLFDAPGDLGSALQERYELVDATDLPEGVSLFAYRRR